MLDVDPLRAEWRQQRASYPAHRSMTLIEDGLVLGAGTVLVSMEDMLAKCGGLALDSGDERLLGRTEGRSATAYYGGVLRVQFT